MIPQLQMVSGVMRSVGLSLPAISTRPDTLTPRGQLGDGRAPQKRLVDAGCEVSEIVDHVFIRSVYYSDPDGIALEASWWVDDATGRAAEFEDAQLFVDPDPVPAVLELRATGTLMSTPSTRLT